MNDSAAREMHFDRSENNEQAGENTWACYASWQTSQAGEMLLSE